MLGYEWVNQSPITLSPQEAGQNPPHNRPVFDPYTSQNYASPTHFLNSETHFPAPSSHHQQYQIPTNPLPNFSDPRSYTHNPPPHDSSFVLEPDGPTSFSFKQEHEPSVNELEFNMELSSRIGLNLGRRTYFANSEDNFVNRLYRRSRILEPGLVNSPHCQAEGCNADLTLAKHYHRRHKVCEFHSKAATVVAAGLTQRFCQQCSRFHLLSEFDNGKRSCRRRLADHNRRRRKSQQTNRSQFEANVPISSSENLDRSPSDSGQHSSTVTIAISPPRISLDCFGPRSYTGRTTPSTSSIFYSNEL